MLGLLSSESYATAVRGTCYGISAAIGKTGAAVGTQAFLVRPYTSCLLFIFRSDYFWYLSILADSTTFRETVHVHHRSMLRSGRYTRNLVSRWNNKMHNRFFFHVCSSMCSLPFFLHLCRIFIPNLTGEDLANEDVAFNAYLASHGWEGEMGEKGFLPAQSLGKCIETNR